jgi:glycosyltransferase involved in cell wall biosynthesis
MAMIMSADDPIVCLSHLRWNFVFQRPQHLMSRAARTRPVLFFEEPICDAGAPDLELRGDGNVTIAVPHLCADMNEGDAEAAQRAMLDHAITRTLAGRPVLWFYTPMALPYANHIKARSVVYDCMDELSLFHGAPPMLIARERQLLDISDVVFTGGYSLFAHKRATTRHRNIHAFPSSVDVPHFACAREELPDPLDQRDIPRPRVGFFGVIDERMDLQLLRELAELRPDLQLVMIGPVVKIDPATLPQAPNIHWLGGKSYEQLPSYLSGWSVAMLPFARNEATRFISPTKTPEYLAAGAPVVSTSITDVVNPYGVQGLAWIADTALEMSDAIDEALASDREARLAHADAFLEDLSWDRTWSEMWRLVELAINRKVMRQSGLHAVSGAGSIRPGFGTRRA